MEREKLIKLVTGAQKNEPAAMEALFSEFYNDVYYFALKTVKNEELACDITQETFLEIIRTIDKLKEPAAFVTWMKQITYHQCTRHFKKSKEVLVDEDEDGNSLFDTLTDESEGSIPAEVYEKEEFRKTIMDMIDQLSEEQRSAVLMYYFDELSVGQIASIQGVSEGTVKSRLNYARKAIKKSVEGYEKKHGIRLHSFALTPLLLLYFGKELMPAAKAAQIQGAVMSAAGASAAAATATGGAGLLAKLAAAPLGAKIAGAAAAVAVTAAAGVALVSPTAKPEPQPVPQIPEQSISGEITVTHLDENGDWLCDHCSEGMCILLIADHSDPNGDCVCDGCCEVFLHVDGTDPHGSCDQCGIKLDIVDADGDGACDICGNYRCSHIHGGSHGDEDGNSTCDVCSEPMCSFYLAQHTVSYDDRIYDERCDVCGQTIGAMGGGDECEHANDDGDSTCDNCGKPVCRIWDMPQYGGVDNDGDETCDVCTEYLCTAHFPNFYHYDFDEDVKCDRCQRYICGMGYIDHADGNGDGICDFCWAGV